MARKVTAKELSRNPKAREKMKAETDQLEQKGVWDLSGVRSWREVADEASASG